MSSYLRIRVANYIVTAKLGGGKTLIAVRKIQEALFNGLRVATNIDLNLDVMLGPNNKKANVTRIPDRPRLEDLESLGYGCESQNYDEEKFGLLVIDECALIFNTRNYRDKGRQKVIDYLIHLRKMRWHGFFIVQNEAMLDKQIRDALGEHVVACKKLSRMPIPFIGKLGKMIRGKPFMMPPMHIAVVVYKEGGVDMKVDSWWYKGSDLYKAYDTGQRFSEQIEEINGEVIDGRGNYTLLPPWYTVGRYLKPKSKIKFKEIPKYSIYLIALIAGTLARRSPRAFLQSVGLVQQDKIEYLPVRDYYDNERSSFAEMTTRELHRYINANPRNEYYL